MVQWYVQGKLEIILELRYEGLDEKLFLLLDMLHYIQKSVIIFVIQLFVIATIFDLTCSYE